MISDSNLKKNLYIRAGQHTLKDWDAIISKPIVFRRYDQLWIPWGMHLAKENKLFCWRKFLL